MDTKRIRTTLLPLLLAALLPLGAQAAGHGGDSIRDEISRDLAEARREVAAELAKTRTELKTGNLSLGDDLNFGKRSKHRGKGKGEASRPKAEITPAGDFLVDGKPVAIDEHQRRELLAYRAQVIDIALAGIDIGERSAELALAEVDRGLFSLMFAAMTGSLERRLERTIKASIEPGVRQICRSLPGLMERQQKLAASLPEFRPYATLEADDAEECEEEVRREFASN